MRTVALLIIAGCVVVCILEWPSSSPPPRSAATQASVPVSPSPPGVRARIGFGTKSLDVTALGRPDAARALCEATVQHELQLRIEGVSPHVVRGCDVAALPAFHHDPGYVMRRHREVDDVDLMLMPGHGDVAGATATIDEVDVFTTAAHCEEIRQRLVDYITKQAAVPSPALQLLADEAKLARQQRDRACGAATDDACRLAKEKVEILENTAARQQPTPPREIPPCLAE